MPWADNSDLPESVRSVLPAAAQTVFRTVANGRIDSGASDTDAIRYAWGAVKNGWKKSEEGRWVKKGSTDTLYMRRNVLNTDDLVEWAKGQGFETTLDPNELHVTIAFSRDPVDWSKVGANQDPLVVVGGPRSVKPLGDKGAVVLHMESQALSDRWQEILDQGASWDHDGYHPHMTITYQPGDVDLSKVEPYRGPIVLGPEVQEPLDDDWADKVVEKKDWEESQHPRDENGRFTDKPGDPADYETYYHGTAAAYVEKIRKEGLLSLKDYTVKRSRFLDRHAKGRVFVTQNRDDAEAYGLMAAEQQWKKIPEKNRPLGRQMYITAGGTGEKYPAGRLPLYEVAVLHFRVPKKVAASFKKDPYDNIGSERTSDDPNFVPPPRGGKFTSSIPAKYLVGWKKVTKDGRHNTYQRFTFKADDSEDLQDLYVVAFCDDGSDVPDAVVEEGVDMPEGDYVKKFSVAKVDAPLGLVFGWAIVCKQDGELYFDTQGDHIPETAMLKAACDFMLHSRMAKEMHAGDAKGTVLFAWPMTADVAKAMGLTTSKTGFMIAMKPDDPAILDKFRSGEYTGFSIGGRRVKDKVLD